MASKQGDLALLQHPVAQLLLRAALPARLAYTWPDGSPRVVPIWFHWTGQEVVMGTAASSPKVKALTRDPRVALTIDQEGFPAKVLMLRGRAHLQEINGVVPEYGLAARRYMGDEQGAQWIAQAGNMFQTMVRVSVRPEWVGVIDFEQRFPSAIESAMK